MQKRQMAAALIQSGKIKEGMDFYNSKENSEITKELAKKDAEAVGKNRESSMVAQDMLGEIKDFKGILKDTSDMVVGPISSIGGANEMFSSNAQKLAQIGSNLTLQARRLLQMPASGFSDADRDFLTKATLNTRYDKDTLNHVADKLETLARKSVVKNKFNEQYVKSKGSLDGADYEFFQYNDGLEKQAQDAIQRGANQEAVNARLLEMRGF